MSDSNDLTSANFFRDPELIEDPYPYFDALRSQCPIQHEPHQDVLMVTGYDEAVEIYNDTEHFSSATSVTGPFPGFSVPLEGDDVSDIIEEHRDELPFSDQLPTFDPPKHTAHRGLLMRLITPKRLKENEEFMWQLADRQLDTFLATGTCEYVGEFGNPYALLVIADLLGVPEDDQKKFTEKMLHRPEQDAVGSGDKEMSHNPLEFLYEEFGAFIEDRRANPTGDVLTGLAQATFPDGSTPEVIDVVRVATNLFAAGQETTVRLLSYAMKLLAEDQVLQAKIRGDRELIPNFIEECLRHESPVKGDFRLSKCPVSVGGVDAPAGTTFMVLNGAANRDPDKFPEPHTFDHERDNARQHLAFGRGIHTCPGAPLARSETRIALERFLDRTSGFHISEEHHGPAGERRYGYVPTFILRGLTKLHLEFDPVEA